MEPEVARFCVLAVIYLAGIAFLANSKKIWRKKWLGLAWFLVLLVGFGIYVAVLTYLGGRFLYKEALTPLGHRLTEPSNIISFIGLILIGVLVVFLVRTVRQRRRDYKNQ